MRAPRRKGKIKKKKTFIENKTKGFKGFNRGEKLVASLVTFSF
jgi:hypothetical protein